MKWLALMGLLVLVAPQDQAGKQEKKPCDCSKIEDGVYCPKCNKILYKNELFKIDLFDKDGTCKECHAKPEKIKVCAKQWIPECRMCNGVPHAVCCCKSKTCCKLETVYAFITFRCENCKAESHFEDKIQHKEGAKDCKIVRICEKSGTYPHGGELPAPKEK